MVSDVEHVVAHRDVRELLEGVDVAARVDFAALKRLNVVQAVCAGVEADLTERSVLGEEIWALDWRKRRI